MNATHAALRRVHRAAIIFGEGGVLNAVMNAIRAFLALVRRLILGGGREPSPERDRDVPVTLVQWPDPLVWRDLVVTFVVPAEAEVWDRQTGEWDTDRFRTEYLTEVPNRLSGFPDEVFDVVRDELEKGQQAGESIPKLRDRVADVLDIESGNWGWRAERIARTETIAAYNGGAYAALVAESNVSGIAFNKRWFATDDDRTRPTHDVADGQVRGLYEPFTVGGVPMMFPGDPTAPPRETVNCRCTLLAA